MRDQKWRGRCLRILNSGVEDEADWPIAKELIDKKWGHGHYQMDYTSRSSIAKLLWSGPTLDGLLGADDLAEQMRRSTLRHRLQVTATHILAWAGGVAACLIDKWGHAFL